MPDIQKCCKSVTDPTEEKKKCCKNVIKPKEEKKKCCKNVIKPKEDKKLELNKALEEAANSNIDPRTIENHDPTDNLEVISEKKPTKKRRCANCNCQNKPEKPSEAPVAKSECGSCSLGDAFRCDGCPYKGMPAFKEGEDFKFDSNVNDL
ncbi:electron carrier [Glugoides intestinalis]